MNDEYFMRLALRLARKGAGFVSPNPMVGAVIVKDAKIISTGYHQLYGMEHAEVKALKAAGKRARGSTMYVTLEPCVHYGKTPPCAPQIIEAGIKRVVIAMTDPNPVVSGKGVQMLKDAGIDVRVGVLEKEARKLNEAFIKHITTDYPFVLLKIALSLDGKIATARGDARWISSENSRKVVHRLRAFYDAVLVGIGTLISDDPMLNVRMVKGRDPFKIVLDTYLRISEDANVIKYNPEKLIIVCGRSVDSDKEERLLSKGVRVWHVKERSGRIDVGALMKRVHQEGIASVMVEGGKCVFSSFLKSGLVDKMIFFVAPVIIGKGLSPFDDIEFEKVSEAIRFDSIRYKRVGSADIMVEVYP